MTKHDAPGASLDTFDGDAISRADREFLASLGDHPLMRNPLYSVAPPPRPDYGGSTAIPDMTAAQQACFSAALDWMLVNYAYYAGAFKGKGGVISLVDGKMTTVASMRILMQPFTIVEEGPRGGLKRTSVIDVWAAHPQRAEIDDVQTRPDKPRPTFTENGLTVYNRYWPPAHPAEGGEIETFETFFARLLPDAVEREWVWHWLCHKARKPWVPMVAIIMVAEEFGTGRGTLFDILDLLFGEDYVVPCTFGELTGTSASARFNARLGNALFAVVNEAVAEEGHQAIEEKHQAHGGNHSCADGSNREGLEAYAQRSAMSTIIATQHRDVVKLPHDDRRFEVPSCGRKMTPGERTKIREWMADPKNIGALYRALLATPAAPLDVFDPYGVPPPFAGRLAMIGMGETRLEEAYGAAIDALEGFPLFTMTQVQRLIGYFGTYTSGDWSNMARHTVAKNAYRLRERSEPNNRIKYLKRDEIIYARTAAAQKRWHGADREMIVAALDRTEKQVASVVHGSGSESSGGIDIVAQIEELRRKPPEDEE